MVADINLDVRGYSQEAGHVAYRQILERLQRAPGVAAAGAARVTVLSGGARTVSVSLDGRPIGAGRQQQPRRPRQRRQRRLPRGARHSRRCAGATSPPPTIAGAARSPSSASRSHRGCGPMRIRSARPLAMAQTTDGRRHGARHRVSQRARAGAPALLLCAAGAELRIGRRAARPRPPRVIRWRCCPAFAQRSATSIPRIVVARPQRLRDVFEQSIADQRMMATLVGLFGAVALLLARSGCLRRDGAPGWTATHGDRHPSRARRAAVVDFRR